MKIVLLGPPMAGKGTQASMLADRFGMMHLATGDLLREAVAAGNSLGKKAKKFMDKGALVPDAIVIGLLENKIKLSNSQTGFILDGFPRTIDQARRMDEIADIDLVLAIDIGFDRLVERATGRRTCKKCGAVYHLKFNPPKRASICDRDGDKLYQRDDDKEIVIRNRLRTYEAQTKPVIQYYESRGKLKYIPGEGTIDDIQKRLTESLRDQWPGLKERAKAPKKPAKGAPSRPPRKKDVRKRGDRGWRGGKKPFKKKEPHGRPGDGKKR